MAVKDLPTPKELGVRVTKCGWWARLEKSSPPPSMLQILFLKTIVQVKITHPKNSDRKVACRVLILAFIVTILTEDG